MDRNLEPLHTISYSNKEVHKQSNSILPQVNERQSHNQNSDEYASSAVYKKFLKVFHYLG